MWEVMNGGIVYIEEVCFVKRVYVEVLLYGFSMIFVLVFYRFIVVYGNDKIYFC